MKVLITGGTNGMGKGVAKALAACPDVEVVILGRSEKRGRETCEELSRMASPGRVSFLTWKNGAFIEVDENPASLAPADWERLWNVSLELCGDEQTRRCAERLESPSRSVTRFPAAGASGSAP